jgi:hypothetical protein
MLLMSRLALEVGRPRGGADGLGGAGGVRRIGRIGLRLRVWLRALDLDRVLAEGRGTAGSPQLALRARLLVSPRSRASLAAALFAAVDRAALPPRPSVGPPLAAASVLAAAGPLVSLARDLTSLERPAVRGVALASWLVCDCAASPLYGAGSPWSVREVAREARSALASA